jgi:hypothetical protein
MIFNGLIIIGQTVFRSKVFEKQTYSNGLHSIYNGWLFFSSIMTQWTDSQVQETASVASTAEAQLGSNINIPQNQTWNISSLYWAHAGDGTGRIAVDSIPGMTGVYPVNSNDPGSVGTNAGSALAHPVNFTIAGPAVVSAFITPDSSSSTVGQFAMKYQVMTQG